MPGIEIQSSYQLPETYGETKITLLAINPHLLYAYWEISSGKLKNFEENVEPQIIKSSIPALKVKNISKNTVDFIRLNEFSASWYINVPDSGCIYMVEIGRNILDEFFISFASSNHVITPNANISLNDTICFVNYRDISKTVKINIPGKREGIAASLPLEFLEKTASSFGIQ